MRAFIDDADDLILWVDVETPDDLAAYDDIEELISVLVPEFFRVPNDTTNTPIYRFRNEVYHLPDYLTSNPLELLRDNQELILKAVKL